MKKQSQQSGIFPRKHEISELLQICNTDKSEFLYLRGRRRVGKSWILLSLKELLPSCFLFTGAKDASIAVTKQTFIRSFGNFSSNSTLAAIDGEKLSWPEILELITKHIQAEKHSVTLVFDEIQWIARENSGFISALKTAWVSWQKLSNTNVIVCGSSHKFFSDHVGGEEKILRGIQTRPEYWIHPFTPLEIHKHLTPNWNLQETYFLFMITGGIPYYLERLNAEAGFIQSINDAYFLKLNHLLDEPKEILSLDFNTAGTSSATKILANISAHGSTHGTIAKRSGLSLSTTTRVLDKLLQYELIYEKSPAFTNKSQKSVQYAINDLFLHFYFRALIKVETKIRFNDSGLIFPSSVHLENYYIPDYSGSAFELSLRVLLNKHLSFDTSFRKKLLIRDHNYQLMYYWDKNNEIDLLIYSPEDRLLRLLECKWGEWSYEHIAAVRLKTLPSPKGVTLKRFLITGSTREREAGNDDVSVLSIRDLYR